MTRLSLRLTKPGPDLMRRVSLRRAARNPGGVAERLKAADCKCADVRLRRFESYALHQRFEVAAGTEVWGQGSGRRIPGGRDEGRGRSKAEWKPRGSAGAAQKRV